MIADNALYTALLRRLATGPKNRTPDHFDSQLGEVAVRLREGACATPFKQSFSAALRLQKQPAILATMVSALYNKTPIAAAVLSSPDRIRLTDEEINDVFDYLKLRNLMAEPDSLEDLYATSAAYAGYDI